MNRREFLCLSGLAAVSTLTLATNGADPHGYLAGWRSAPLNGLGPTPLDTDGQLPRGVVGTLFRNGPGLFERAGVRYQHWFDGDGLIHAWRLAENGASHVARFVQTRKFKREQEAGRFLVSGAGTTIENGIPISNPDDLNAANTAVIMHGGQLLALWEGGSAHALDPHTLRTSGPVTLRPDLTALPFSAHPLRDARGHLWNFGHLPYLDEEILVVWELGVDGALVRAQLLPINAPGYIHSFTMTDRHLVFVFSPWVLADDLSATSSYFEALRWEPERGNLAVVIDKESLSEVARHPLPSGLIYHWIDATERDGHIAVRGCWHDDAKSVFSPFSEQLAGRPTPVDRPPSQSHVAEVTLPLGAGEASASRLAERDAEFPTCHPDGRFFCVGAQAPMDASGYSNAVTAYAANGRVQAEYRYPAGQMAEEHRCVVDGQNTWLVGTVLDWANARSGVSVLDADRLADGPVYQAWAPYTVPLGFHGDFVTNA